LTPQSEAAMLQQLRMQEASLKRLERFRGNPRDAVLYIIQLMAAGLLTFVLAVYLYPFRVETQGLSILPAITSLFFFIIAILEEHNMTDTTINKEVARLEKTIAEAKAKLKLTE
jgi:hypothetical protein